MAEFKPRYEKAEFARLGQEIFEPDIRPHVTLDDEGKFVAVDIETGLYEINRDDYTATERLLECKFDAQIWLLRIGDRAAYRIGWHPVEFLK